MPVHLTAGERRTRERVRTPIFTLGHAKRRKADFDMKIERQTNLKR